MTGQKCDIGISNIASTYYSLTKTIKASLTQLNKLGVWIVKYMYLLSIMIDGAKTLQHTRKVSNNIMFNLF